MVSSCHVASKYSIYPSGVKEIDDAWVAGLSVKVNNDDGWLDMV